MRIRTIHLASFLLLLLANLVVALLVLPGDAFGEQEPESVPAKHLFTYPRGSNPDLISDLPSGKGDERLYGGIVAIPVTGKIFFYDLDFDNIKVIDPTDGTLLRLIKGPQEDREGSWPWDMAVTPDGTITVLIERRDESLDFRRLSPTDSSWTRVVRVKPSTLFHKRIAGYSCQLNTDPEGTVYAYFTEYKQSIVVDTIAALAIQNRLAEARSRAISGMVGADGLFYLGSREIPGAWESEKNADWSIRAHNRNGELICSIPAIPGSLCGVSMQGTLAIEGAGKNVVVDPREGIIATFQYPRTKDKPARMLAGSLLEFILSPGGTLYSFHITEGGLEVYLHWKEE